jgi:hypothetical protein
VLLAACKCPDVGVVVGDPGFERDWARCLYILHHYEDQITSATQAIQVLEVMKQSVSGNGVPTQRKHFRGHPTFFFTDSSLQQHQSSSTCARSSPITQCCLLNHSLCLQSLQRACRITVLCLSISKVSTLSCLAWITCLRHGSGSSC